MKILKFVIFFFYLSNLFGFNSRFLAIGETNHDTSHGLDQLIRAVGNVDDDVTRIFIEGPRNYKNLYKNLSFSPLAEKEIVIESMYNELICHPLWINQVTKLFPLVRKINDSRKKRHVRPLIVIPIDGAHSENITNIDIIKTDENNLFISEECSVSKQSLIQEFNFYLWLASYEREVKTASNFINEIDDMRTSDKAIIFYHQGHLFKKAKTCIPSFIGGKVDVSPRFGSWLQIVLDQRFIDVHVKAIHHNPIFDESEPGQFLYGIMSPKSDHPNYINSLFHIFYEENMFDSILDLSNKSYDWLPTLENKFRKNVSCDN